jgi:hypothetical protein
MNQPIGSRFKTRFTNNYSAPSDFLSKFIPNLSFKSESHELFDGCRLYAQPELS